MRPSGFERALQKSERYGQIQIEGLRIHEQLSSYSFLSSQHNIQQLFQSFDDKTLWQGFWVCFWMPAFSHYCRKALYVRCNKVSGSAEVLGWREKRYVAIHEAAEWYGCSTLKALAVFYAIGGFHSVRSFTGIGKKHALSTLKEINNLLAILKFGDSATQNLHRSF